MPLCLSLLCPNYGKKICCTCQLAEYKNQVFFYYIFEYLVFVLLAYSENEEVSILTKLSAKKSVEIRYQNYCFVFLNVLPFKILTVEAYATMLAPRRWLLCPNYEKNLLCL